MQEAIFWLVLFILFLIVEIITVGLTTIWFAGGSLVALLANAIGLDFVWQVVVFFIVSVVLLVFTRPFATKYINSNKLKTKYEGIIGKVVRVTERVDNINSTGTAVVNGVEWTARAEKDGQIIEKDKLAKIVHIDGVKLILEECKDI